MFSQPKEHQSRQTDRTAVSFITSFPVCHSLHIISWWQRHKQSPNTRWHHFCTPYHTHSCQVKLHIPCMCHHLTSPVTFIWP